MFLRSFVERFDDGFLTVSASTLPKLNCAFLSLTSTPGEKTTKRVNSQDTTKQDNTHYIGSRENKICAKIILNKYLKKGEKIYRCCFNFMVYLFLCFAHWFRSTCSKKAAALSKVHVYWFFVAKNVYNALEHCRRQMHLYNSVYIAIVFEGHPRIVESNPCNHCGTITKLYLGSICLISLRASIDQNMVACYIHQFISP